MKLKRLRAAIAEQVEGHIGQPEKKRQQRAERRSVSTLQLLSMHSIWKEPLWYLVHNQMIQNKRSQLVRDINICCSAYGWCRHMLWSICLVCQVEQANPWGKTPTNISTSKKFAFTIFPDEMCKWRQIRFPPTSALVNLFWQVVVGWRENLLCKLFVTLCVHHANGASKDDERRQVCHVLPGCHLRKELPFWRQCFTNRPVQPQGIDSMFCGNQLFSSVRVTVARKMFGDK